MKAVETPSMLQNGFDGQVVEQEMASILIRGHEDAQMSPAAESICSMTLFFAQVWCDGEYLEENWVEIGGGNFRDKLEEYNHLQNAFK